MSQFINVAYVFIMASLSLFLVILFCMLLFIICKNKPLQPEDTLPLKPSAANAFPLTEIHAATEGFGHHKIIGKGRLGIVYAAVLSTTENVVAVKRIHPHLVLSNAGLGFSTKIKSLSLAQHPNLVPIIGFSEAPGERIIIMKYVGTLSLHFYLHQCSDASPILNWSGRLKVVAAAARGLEYLHEIMAPPIIHGCVKASNILVDENFVARVSGYGMSFLKAQEKGGLVRYVDDEYWVEAGGACKESDVYGFGVVLLEILSGRNGEEGELVKWALPLIKEMRFGELWDPRLVLPCNVEPLIRVAKLALACLGNSRKTRPNMAHVAVILNTLEDSN